MLQEAGSGLMLLVEAGPPVDLPPAQSPQQSVRQAMPPRYDPAGRGDPMSAPMGAETSAAARRLGGPFVIRFISIEGTELEELASALPAGNKWKQKTICKGFIDSALEASSTARNATTSTGGIFGFGAKRVIQIQWCTVDGVAVDPSTAKCGQYAHADGSPALIVIGLDVHDPNNSSNASAASTAEQQPASQAQPPPQPPPAVESPRDNAPAAAGEQNASAALTRTGIIRSVNARERTCAVSWAAGPGTGSQDTPDGSAAPPAVSFAEAVDGDHLVRLVPLQRDHRQPLEPLRALADVDRDGGLADAHVDAHCCVGGSSYSIELAQPQQPILRICAPTFPRT